MLPNLAFEDSRIICRSQNAKADSFFDLKLFDKNGTEKCDLASCENDGILTNCSTRIQENKNYSCTLTAEFIGSFLCILDYSNDTAEIPQSAVNSGMKFYHSTACSG